MRYPIALLLLVIGVAVGGVLIATNSFGADRDHLPPAASVPPPPALSHVWVIVIENKPLSTILGSADAPYMNELIGKSGLATDYRAVGHPSQPNYVALFSGSTQRVTDNEPHDIAAKNLADELEAAGRTWHVYAENVPPNCFQGATAQDGPDGPGTYARKHEPAISFTSISGNPSRCANILPFSGFDAGAADFSLIIPNLCHAMHDCGIADGDAWLRSFVPQILESAAWRDGGVLFVTFDEGLEFELAIEPGRHHRQQPFGEARDDLGGPAHALLAAADHPGRVRPALPRGQLFGEHARRVLHRPIARHWLTLRGGSSALRHAGRRRHAMSQPVADDVAWRFVRARLSQAGGSATR